MFWNIGEVNYYLNDYIEKLKEELKERSNMDLAYFIVSKDKIFFDPDSNSCDEIIEKFEISDYNKDDYICTIFVPDDYDYKRPTDEWSYETVEYSLKYPEWFIELEYEIKCRELLKEWYEKRFINSNKTLLSGKINKIVISGVVNIKDMNDGILLLYGNSIVNIKNFNGGEIILYDNSICEIESCNEDSYITAWDNSVINIEILNGGNGEVFNDSYCNIKIKKTGFIERK